jgi:hypothetical protein
MSKKISGSLFRGLTAAGEKADSKEMPHIADLSIYVCAQEG